MTVQRGPVDGLPAVRSAPDPTTHHYLPAGSVWACDMPERAADRLTAWSNDCHACIVHLAATLHCVPQMRAQHIEYRPDAGEAFYMVSMADSISYEAQRRENPILVNLAASYGGDADRIRNLIGK